MDYDIPLRLFARLFLEAPPALAGARALSAMAEALQVDDLGVQPLSQVTLSTGALLQRVALVSPNGAWQVITLGESVDVAFFPQASNGEPVDMEEFFSRAGEVLAAVAELSENRAHRIASVSEGLLPAMDPDRMDDVAGRLLNYPRTFQPAPWEWNWRCVATVDRMFGDLTEATNTIVTAKRVAGTLTQSAESFDRIRLDFDINTNPKNPEPRFDSASVRAFFAAACGWHMTLRDEISAFAELGENAQG